MKEVKINPEFDCYVKNIQKGIEENIKDEEVKAKMLDGLENISDMAKQWNEEYQTIDCNIYKDSDGRYIEKIDAEFTNTIKELIRLFALQPEEREEKEYVDQRFEKCMELIMHNYFIKNIRIMVLIGELRHHGLYNDEIYYQN